MIFGPLKFGALGRSLVSLVLNPALVTCGLIDFQETRIGFEPNVRNRVWDHFTLENDQALFSASQTRNGIIALLVQLRLLQVGEGL